MPVSTAGLRAAVAVLLSAASVVAATLPASAAPRPAAVDPTSISASASAATIAAEKQAVATQARTAAEQAVAESTTRLDHAAHALLAARNRLSRLSQLVDEATDRRRHDGGGLLEVAADTAEIVAGIVGPVGEALDPLADAVEPTAPEMQPITTRGGAEHELRVARASASRAHRAAAEEVAAAEQAVGSAAAALTAAQAAEVAATEMATAALAQAADFAASLGIDKRLVRPATGAVSSPYGMRVHPVTGAHRLHTGIDFQVGNGHAYAAASGTVAAVTRDPSYGNLVTIAHGQGVTTRYAHLAVTRVSPGDTVTPGQVVGEIGSTGLSTGPHLHFEIGVDGRLQDPAGWLGG